MAAGGPRPARSPRILDTVHLAAAPLATRDDVAAMAADVRKLAGDRDVTLALNLFAVGDGDLPPWTDQMTGSNAATLRAHDSLALLPGLLPAMADGRRHAAPRRLRLGIAAAFLEPMAPVVELLNDRK